MAEEEEKPIRVIDRRMFTPEGELRPDFEPDRTPEAPPAAPPRPRASGRAAERPSPAPAAPPPPEEYREEEPEAAAMDERAEPRGEFVSLVRSLATSAYASLGLLADPATGARHRDPAAARQIIDWLGVLEQKTRNNLSFEESDFLARVLYELRLSFVEATRPPAR